MKILPLLPALALTIGTLLAASASASQEAAAKPAPAQAAAQDPNAALVRSQKASYPLDTCVISGEKLGEMGTPVEHVVEGRLVRLCCKGCTKGVDKDPAAAFAKIDSAVVAAQKPSYPMTTCPVTGEKLGEKAVDHVHGTRLVRLANADAVASFKKDPAPAMAKVDKALVQAQLASYPAKVCVVSNEAFGGEMGDPVEYLHGTKLVRLCCKSCIKSFEKDPQAYLTKLEKK
jgi:hypothetical protein